MTKVVFIVPIRHPKDTKNAEDQKVALIDLLSSFSAQTDSNFIVNIVCNTEQTLPDLPEFAKRIDVSFLPNTALRVAASREEAYESIREDKGRRVHAGLKLVDPGKDMIMVCDDDDLIHRRLVEEILLSDGDTVRFVEKGYRWISGTSLISELIPFHKACGTSLAIPAKFYKAFDDSCDQNEAIKELGSHRLPFDNMMSSGRKVKPFDFFAAVYRVQGSNSTQIEVARARAVASQKSGAAKIIQSIGRKIKGSIYRAPPVLEEKKEPETIDVGPWFSNDFLGGRPFLRD